MKKQLLLFAALLFCSAPCAAQFHYPVEYRPPVDWQQLTTDHFRIVYPEDADSSARQTAAILESQYDEARLLVGGELRDFPVILRDYNDRSNGFVTSLHFRSEMDLSPSAGKTLNPRSGSWLETVAPHELVHALQYSNLGGFTLPSVVALFSPDLGRSFHGAIPSGLNEGIATYFETTGVTPDGGRGNLPWFTNRFRSVFESPQRWSMGQMVHSPLYTLPFDRHYLGGYHLVSWLQERHGEGVTRDALDFYVRFPFLGYGFALRHATGSWPSRLYDQFVAAYSDSGASATEAGSDYETKTSKNGKATLLSGIPREGTSVRSPKWLDDSTLVFHASFYNRKPGFYRYRLESGRMDRMFATRVVSDYHYDLSSDGRQLLYAWYRPSSRFDNAFSADLSLYRTDTGERRELSRHGRLYSPVFTEEGILAIQPDGSSTRLVLYHPESERIEVLLDPGPHQVTAVASHPTDPGRLAVAVNRRGVQALWIIRSEQLEKGLPPMPDVAFPDASIYDPVWHPREHRLLFSSDRGGTHQLYEYHPESGKLIRLTRGGYNAIEGSYSPSGRDVAWVEQRGNLRLPITASLEDLPSVEIPRDHWKAPDTVRSLMRRPLAGSTIADTAGWSSQPYRTGGSWLRPRAVLPLFEEVSNREVYELGLSLQSSDLLQQQSYSLDISRVQDRFWYDLTYRNARFFPGFEFGASSTPSYRDFNFVVEEDTIRRTLLRQQRNFSLAVPFRLVLENNVFFSSLSVRPEIRRSQIRYFELHHAGDPSSDFGNLTIGKIFAALNYRLQQNTRDLQPNSGLSLFGQVEHYFDTQSTRLHIHEKEFQLTFIRPTALRAGLFGYISPLRRYNHSLRLGVETLTQTAPVFDNQNIVSSAFSEPVYPLSNNLTSLSARYVLPLAYPDDGGLLIPAYLANLYLSLFGNTVFDPSNGGISDSRSVVGMGIRTRFKISNLLFDIGIGIGYETGTKNFSLTFGDF